MSLYAEEAQIHSGVLHICKIDPPAFVHLQSQPDLVLPFHILLQQVYGVHYVHIITITCRTESSLSVVLKPSALHTAVAAAGRVYYSIVIACQGQNMLLGSFVHIMAC